MWFKAENQYATLSIYVKPNAKKTAILEVKDNELNISIHAKPQEGEANKELIAHLAKILQLPKTQVVLLKGETSRHKIVKVPLTQKVRELIGV